jgi:predicted outer membrane repeat protein
MKFPMPLVLFLLLVSSIARATIITVTSPSSGSNDGSGCTLRDAIQAVNTRVMVGQCAAGSGPVDTINAPLVINDFTQRDPHSDYAALPTLIAGRSLNIFGATTLRRAPNGGTGQHFCATDGRDDPTEFRLLEVQAGATIYLSHINFQYGCADGLASAQNDTAADRARGGAIVNYGTLYLVQSVLFQNQADGWGGAIYNGPDAQLGLSYVDFESNSGNGGGGALFVDSDNNNYAEVDAGLFYQNQTIYSSVNATGGAIRSRGTLIVLNSTFNDNSASDGGGIYSTGALGLSFSSFMNDSGPGARELAIAANSTAFIKSSLFGTNTGSNCVAGGLATVSWSGVSISSDASCAGGSNLTNTFPGFDVNLGNNGGPTQTLMLKSASPALHADSDCLDVYGTPITTDQRGSLRPLTHCDAGAFEDTIFANDFQ